ncbi:hypothetical protein BC828DRAFT_64979 [Blastocladiella britannica]|nr:hypothetical protein BC828DRAFT_64979 [Blastocladiella britannica]
MISNAAADLPPPGPMIIDDTPIPTPVPTVPNPTDFSFDLRPALEILHARHRPREPITLLFRELTAHPIADRHCKERVLAGLANLLLESAFEQPTVSGIPALADDVISLFRPLLIDLVARVIADERPEDPTREPRQSAKSKRRRDHEDPIASTSAAWNDSARVPAVADFETLEDAMDVDSPDTLVPSPATRHERVAVMLSTVVMAAPQIAPLAARYFATHPPPCDRMSHLATLCTSDASSSSSSPAAGDSPVDSETAASALVTLESLAEPILVATYRLASAIPTLLARWPHLHNLQSLATLPTISMRSRVAAGHIVSLALGLSDEDRTVIVKQLAGPSAVESEYMFFALEERETHKALQVRLGVSPFTSDEQVGLAATGPTPALVDASFLSSYVADVCGILILTDSHVLHRGSSVTATSTEHDDVAHAPLIETLTTRRNMFSTALALSRGAPVLLEGVTGSGKSSLVAELGRRLGVAPARITSVHLGDAADAKSLLGTYVATATPGQFAWTRGVLARAVEDGHWLLLEDLDLASRDVISILVPLLEKRTLFIAQRGQSVTAHPQFRLFATAALDPFTGAPRAAGGAAHALGASLWTRVVVAALPRDELTVVLTRRFPRLAPVVPRIVETYQAVQRVAHDPAHRAVNRGGGRYVSTRDVVRWCTRADTFVAARAPHGLNYTAVDLDENVMDPLAREAVDVFATMIPAVDVRTKVLVAISTALGVVVDKLEYLLASQAPEIQYREHEFSVGRVTLPIPAAHAAAVASGTAKSHPFATTAHAARLLERLAVSVSEHEPVLLVGETGTGKTTVVQHLAMTLGTKLHVINLSQQTEASDLLGGFKPSNVQSQITPLVDEFFALFSSTFSVKKNGKFLDLVRRAYAKTKYDVLIKLFAQAVKMASDRFEKADQAADPQVLAASSSSAAAAASPQQRSAWKTFAAQVEEVRAVVASPAKLIFSFVEGALVQALRRGDWVLLDEVNLASAETLEALSGLLEPNGSLLLTERGDERNVPRHAGFRLFSCMNPSTDVGKRDLPIGLRNRFAEFYVESPDNYLEDLTLIAQSYLASVSHADTAVVNDVVTLYLATKRMAENELYDGAGTRPHYSLRTLSRALSFACTVAPMFGLRRALVEGFAMTFATLLELGSQPKMTAAIHEHLLRGKLSLLKQPVAPPANAAISGEYVQFSSFWLQRGNHVEESQPPYIMTQSVERNIGNLARAVMTAKYPVLIQGPTSSGKTSMIEYLAHVTGHKFVRINNHEHTDLQEYLGGYVSDDHGRLVFKEGALVTALKEGHWIVLDELNLAPTDVLEALNRLLDDNRELFVAETQQVVRPHPHFMLFATQNPPSYGGRKVLSRAFRNRFLELHFDDLPDDELLTILAGRCSIAPSYADAIVKVYQELRRRRQESRMFDGKAAFVTLRDLFRWANRPVVGYQQLAENGWMILGERVRSMAERKLVLEVLHGMKKGIAIDPLALYERIFQEHKDRIVADASLAGIVWNKTMKRLFALTASCTANQEPVLLVGETGCGKTTVCQVLASLDCRPLVVVNCHQHSETSDFIGSQRPVRGGATSTATTLVVADTDSMPDADPSSAVHASKLFEWQDGPLIHAMRQGEYFLLDEISLADDSVLERLNSVLEPSRTIVIAERGGEVEKIKAVDAFRFLATMNPGGDFGKKELSPALRNRFTEIWTDQIEDYNDLHQIVAANLDGDVTTATLVLDYVTWFKDACRVDHMSVVISMRDLIAWAEFISATHATLGGTLSFLHGGAMVLLDGIKSGSFASKCLAELQRRAGVAAQTMTTVHATHELFGIGAFTIPLGSQPVLSVQHSLDAPTSRENLLRVLRALQIPSKAILLEGSPGVGKTSLVAALARLSGHTLVRINLSEQTDLIDLFGSDLPVEGGKAGEFAWRDGPFLAAMKAGDWVLLDELNLASQSVLEGLNACLDHRGSVYLPELDKAFNKHQGFRIFGAQNPLEEGGGRRGLPKSFLNRFTQVHVKSLTDEDLMRIVLEQYAGVTSEATMERMLQFNSQLHTKTMVTREFGAAGSPWEFNLRDVLRWLELMKQQQVSDPALFLDMLYLQRMQSATDRAKVLALWNAVTDQNVVIANPTLQVTPTTVSLGQAVVPRLNRQSEHLALSATVSLGVGSKTAAAHVPHPILRPLESLLTAVNAGWMSMIVGPSGSGKTALARLAAALTGNELVEFAMNSSVDALELLGGFEQVDKTRCLEQLVRELATSTKRLLGLYSVATARGPLHATATIAPEPLRQLATYAAQVHVTEHQFQHWIDLLEYTSTLLGAEPCRERHDALLSKYQLLTDSAGKFEWVDGVFLDAVQHGKWILLDNANLCSPSVLDRLNPLFEQSSHRYLLINERGQNDVGEFIVVHPHPNFRMFMTLDPRFGQISRAMRNRGIEIALTDDQWMHDRHTLAQMLEAKGVTAPAQRRTILSALENHSPRDFVMSSDYIVDLVQRGMSLRHAIQLVSHHSLNLNNEEDEESLETRVPHPPVLLSDSMATLAQSKFSFIVSESVSDAESAVAALSTVEDPANAFQWKWLLDAWLAWHKTTSPPLGAARTAELESMAAVLARLVDTQAKLGDHIVAKCTVQFIKLQLTMEHTFQQTPKLKLSKMNFVQRSHCFHAFPHRISSVEVSPVVAGLYPLLAAFNTSIPLALADSATGADKQLLDVISWMASLWSQCLTGNGATAELNLNLLDAHISQLLSLTAGLPLLAPFRSHLSELQLLYAGDMEASQAVWTLLHPWAVRTAAIYEPVMVLLALNPASLTPQQRDLAVDALTKVFLGDASQQAMLTHDLPRLVRLVQPPPVLKATEPIANGEIADANNLMVHESEITESVGHMVAACVHEDGEQRDAIRDWVWSSVALSTLAQIAHGQSPGGVEPAAAKRLAKHAPTLAHLVHFQLLQWSHSHRSDLERSWNTYYVNVCRVLRSQSPWQPQPKLLSSQLVQSCQSASVVDLGSVVDRLKATANTILDHQDLLRVDLVQLERDLVLARVNVLASIPQSPTASAQLQAAGSLAAKHGTSLVEMGKAWIHAGLAFLELAAPMSPLDPATRFSLVHQATQALQETLQLELRVRIALQLRDNGMDTNQTIDWVRARLAVVSRHVEETARQLYLRPVDADQQLRRLFAEIQSMMASMSGESSFLGQLLAGHESAHQTEAIRVVETSLSMFIERTAKNFPLFLDVLEPLYSGLYDVLHGMSLVSMSLAAESRELVELAALPAIRSGSLSRLVDHACDFDNVNGLAHAVSLLEAVATHRELVGHHPDLMDQVLPLIHALLERFQKRREEESRRRKEEEQSFKYATKTVVLEDEDFDWFRTEDDVHDIHTRTLRDDADGAGLNASTGMMGEQSMDVDGMASEQLKKQERQREREANDRVAVLEYRAFVVYQELFGSWSSAHRLAHIGTQQHCAAQSSGFIHVLALSANHRTLTEPVDNATYDFYRHPNLKESARLRPVLVKLDARAKEFLRQWPDHAALQQLVTVCHRIAVFPATMPLIKFVQSLEFLLEKCDEWEKFAASHVSVRESMTEITTLIVDWRRLELFNWGTLLDYYDAQERKQGASWWLHLYSVLVHSEDLDSKDLISSIDEFVLTSTLGQLELRLQILESLYTHFRLPVLINTRDYYAQFLPFVKGKVARQRSEIERELKDQFKIASWKDVNVYALKQSAQRTHRQLNKCLRKYRLILQEALLPLIGDRSDALFGDQRTPSIHRPVPATGALTQALYFYPPALAKQLEKATSWLSTRDAKLGPILTRSVQFAEQVTELPLPMTAFALEVIEQIASFKAETDKVSQKLAKHEATNMLQVRKKALADFLKQMRGMGLSWRHAGVPSTHDLMLLASPSALAVTAESDSADVANVMTFMPLVDAANTYHMRLVALVQSLPEVMSKRSPDVNHSQAERAIGYATDLFKLSLAERRALVPAVHQYHQLVQQVHLIQVATASKDDDAWVDKSRVAAQVLALSSIALMCQRVVTLNVLSAKATPVVEDLCASALAFLKRFRGAHPLQGPIHVHSARLLAEWAAAKADARAALAETAARCPRDAMLLDGLASYLDDDDALRVDASAGISSLTVSSPPLLLQEVVDAGQAVIEAVMVQLQHVHSFTTQVCGLAASGDNAPFAAAAAPMPTNGDAMDTDVTHTSPVPVKDVHRLVLDLCTKLAATQLPTVMAKVLVWQGPSSVSDAVYHQLMRLRPLLTNLVHALHASVTELLRHHKSVAKASYVLMVNMIKLVQNGFGVPDMSDDQDNSGAAGDGQMEDVEGTGIGQGAGNKDVSDEIEDEEQVLGLKDEKPEDAGPDDDGQDDQQKKEEDKGLEMENDFDGDLEDLNLDGDETNKDQQPESADEDEDEPDLDEGMDQVDKPEDNKVDESLWQDDEEQELREMDDLDEEKINRDSHDVEELEQDQQEAAAEQPANEQDVDMNYEGHVGDDDDQDQEEEKDGGDEEDDSDSTKPDDKAAPDSTEDVKNDDAEADDDDKRSVEGDDADLDEQDAMDVDGDDQSTPPADAHEDEDAQDGQEEADELDPAADSPPDQEEDEDAADRDAEMDVDELYDQQEDKEEEEDGEDEEGKEEEQKEDDETAADQDEQPAAGVFDDASADAMDQDEDAAPPPPDAEERSDDKTKVGMSNRDDGQDDAAERTEEAAEQSGQAEQEARDSAAMSADQSASDALEEQRRSLGDAIREWRERLNVMERDQENAKEDDAADKKDDTARYDADEFEYAADDEEDAAEQTLGAADADQHQSIVPPVPEEDDAAASEEEEEQEEEDGHKETDQPPPAGPTAATAAAMQGPQDGKDDSERDELDSDAAQPPRPTLDMEDDEEEEPLTEEQEQRVRAEIATDLTRIRGSHEPAHELWHKYKAVTHHLAQQLTEQLRLILEPTLAAKLSGDFKTGKRLNLKKIIPYIASDFKKDKIWLRRTKPSKRTYKVMLAVDDSESMATGNAVTLAFESLAVLARAMAQLEVGQLGVAAFGDRVDIVHPFDQPFSDDAGARALSSFTFAQQRTRVGHLVETAAAAFDQASSSGGGDDTWHLLLIISDGVCEDHDRVRNLVRRAAERRILVAFIVLDQKPEAESILKMSAVEFTGGKVVMRRYMETFPFDFYVVLRDVSRLPIVLSDALRQFFALAAQ